MLRSLSLAALGCSLLISGSAVAQTPVPLHEYTAMRAPEPLVIDGKLDDKGWSDAPLTEKFVIYTNGNPTVYPTQCKLLWDDNYLYVAFIMDDRDVWGTTTIWNDTDYCLCSEEVAEVFIDPDGDGLNYMETEINPLRAVMDLRVDKEFAKGGSIDWTWHNAGLKVSISVRGTLNNQADSDTSWVCELAFPYSSMTVNAPTMSFPPKAGDMWRINLYRYDYGRTSAKYTELSGWNQTDAMRGFHAPDRFGKVFFSSQVAGTPTAVSREKASPRALAVVRNYPNPFNPSTSIEFTLPASGAVQLELYNVAGQKCRTLLNRRMNAGTYTMVWDGRGENGEVSPSGIYFARLRMGNMVSTHRMLLLK